MCAFASSILLIGTAQARVGTIVTDTVVSQTAKTQTIVPLTFGQIFKAGDVPREATITATLHGRPIALQVDTKATNPDGSMRHAVLTAILPSLPGNAKFPLALSTEPSTASTAQSVPIRLSHLLDTNYDAKVSLEIDGTRYTADARALLMAADRANTCQRWNPRCNLWLSGPLVSEWVVNGPVTAANGAANPNLSVYFAVRAYMGRSPGTVGKIRTDVIVENDWAYTPQAQPQYTAILTSGKASYTSPPLTQYAFTRWHHVLWWNEAQPEVYLQQDTQYIQNSMAVSRYMPLKPDERFLAGLRQTCAPLDRCDQTREMSTVGAQQGIGPLPRWTSVYIVDPDVRAYNWMLANTDALGAYSIHFRDQATGWPLSIQKHPNVTLAGWGDANVAARHDNAKGRSYKADLVPNCVNNTVMQKCTKGWFSTGNPFKWNNAHQPAESYVPYMVTGSYYYMSELAFGASMNQLWASAAYRGFSKFLIGASHGSMRADAWTLRDMAEAAYLLPDSYPLKTEFAAAVKDSLDAWNEKYSNNPNANPLRVTDNSVVYSLSGGKHNGVAPWQHNFLTWAAGHAAELGFPEAVPFRNWLAKFEIGLMTDWQHDPTHGYCWLQASAYAIHVKDSSGNWLPSFKAVYGETFPTLVGLSCNTPAMVAAMAKLHGNPNPGQVGEMYGYAYSATGFPANFQIGLAAAADSGLADAHAAWQIFESRSVKPKSPHAYNDYPNFAVLPRSVQ